jgi:hypothetical protein
MPDLTPDEPAARKVTFVWQKADNDPAPRPLRIVIPAALGEAATLRTFARAIEEVRDTCVRFFGNSKEAVERAEAAGEPLRLGYARGELSVWRAAAENIDQELFGRFNVWEQEEIEEEPDPEHVRLFADGLGWRPRPEFPFPSPTGETLGVRFVELLGAQRDRYVRLAIQFNRQARQDHIDADGKPESPRHEEYLARANTFATTADHIEHLMADGLGVFPAYEEFVTEHGTWLERVI